MLKNFRGVEPTTKIFYTKFFHNEIISFENFPDYGILNSNVANDANYIYNVTPFIRTPKIRNCMTMVYRTALGGDYIQVSFVKLSVVKPGH